MPTYTLSRRHPASAIEFPTAEIKFGFDGEAIDPADLNVFRGEFAAAGVTDLLVFCGGWAEQDADLRALYDGLGAAARHAVRREPAFSAHTFGVLRVMWPARRWPDSPTRLGLENATDEDRAHRNIAALEMEVTSLRGKFSGRQADRHLLKVWQLISTAGDSVTAQVSLVEHVRELVRGSDEMNQSPKASEYASRQFLAMHPIRLLESVSDPAPLEGTTLPETLTNLHYDDDELAGPPSVPARCDVYQGIRNLLRYAVACEMRVRAESVGRLGLRESLLTLSRALQQTRIHLIGHSFGARAVLTAVDAPIDSGRLIRPKSITLLQPALPENAFAPGEGGAEEGIFYPVLAEGKVGGPILVTCSTGDETADIPYAIARCIAEHSQPGKHSYPDPVAAMGKNGATNSGAINVSLSGRIVPRWKRGMVANLDGSGLIGDHTDVCKPEISYAILSAATTTI